MNSTDIRSLKPSQQIEIITRAKLQPYQRAMIDSGLLTRNLGDWLKRDLTKGLLRTIPGPKKSGKSSKSR